MKFFFVTVVTLLLHCHVTLAAFCSDDEEAGACFEDKIKPAAIAATVIAFVFGIGVVILTTALLCKAKRRRRSKIMVHRKPYQNSGFESATQYYVKRPSERVHAVERAPAERVTYVERAPAAVAYTEPTYAMQGIRNGHRQTVVRDDLDISDSLDMFAGEGKRESYKSSDLVWVPGNGNGNGKKLRAETTGNGSYY